MSIQELLDIMTSMNSLHLQLLELADEKKDVLIQNDIERLNLIVLKESKLVRQITDLEKQRVESIGQYLMKRGFRPDPRITTSDLVKLLFKVEEKQALQEAQQLLLETLLKLKWKNETNQQLAEQAISFLDYSLDLLGGPGDDEMTYGNPAKMQQTYKRSGMFDTRA